MLKNKGHENYFVAKVIVTIMNQNYALKPRSEFSSKSLKMFKYKIWRYNYSTNQQNSCVFCHALHSALITALDIRTVSYQMRTVNAFKFFEDNLLLPIPISHSDNRGGN